MEPERRPLQVGVDNRVVPRSNGLLRAARRNQHGAGRSSQEHSPSHVLRSTFSGWVGSKLAFLTQPLEYVPEPAAPGPEPVTIGVIEARTCWAVQPADPAIELTTPQRATLAVSCWSDMATINLLQRLLRFLADSWIVMTHEFGDGAAGTFCS